MQGGGYNKNSQSKIMQHGGKNANSQTDIQQTLQDFYDSLYNQADEIESEDDPKKNDEIFSDDNSGLEDNIERQEDEIAAGE
jgi:hypothetical protein